MLAICRVAALAAVAEGTIRYVASDDLRRSGKNDFSMHWLFGERFFFILQLMGLFARAVMHCAGSRLTVVVGSRVKTR